MIGVMFELVWCFYVVFDSVDVWYVVCWVFVVVVNGYIVCIQGCFDMLLLLLFMLSVLFYEVVLNVLYIYGDDVVWFEMIVVGSMLFVGIVNGWM